MENDEKNLNKIAFDKEQEEDKKRKIGALGAAALATGLSVANVGCDTNTTDIGKEAKELIEQGNTTEAKSVLQKDKEQLLKEIEADKGNLQRVRAKMEEIHSQTDKFWLVEGGRHQVAPLPTSGVGPTATAPHDEAKDTPEMHEKQGDDYKNNIINPEDMNDQWRKEELRSHRIDFTFVSYERAEIALNYRLQNAEEKVIKIDEALEKIMATHDQSSNSVVIELPKNMTPEKLSKMKGDIDAAVAKVIEQNHSQD
ncbi:MAG: hypothetical protein WC878_00655 [Candidatus Paceibacterota bacterium]|jgi:hypothetical protein